jgi:fluoroquinolone resistance protein
MYFEDQEFKNIDYTSQSFPAGEYEYCRFITCNFSGINLSGIRFTDCHFEGSNLSMVKLGGTGFNDTKFMDCKILGVHFEHCRQLPFSVSFERCILNHSSFYGVKLKQIFFNQCTMQEVDLTDAELQGANFAGCDLLKAAFVNTNLENADLTSAFNFSIDPEKNRLKKAKFSTAGLAGLLGKYDIRIQD